MTYYLVRAKARPDQLVELKDRCDRDEILVMRPFGLILSRS